MKNLFVKYSILSVLMSIGLFSMSAQASCFRGAQIVERVISYGTFGYAYLRPKGALTNANYYYVRINSALQMSLAGDAQTNRSEVNILGNATTCPTTGVARYMGVATYVNIIN